MSRDRVEWARLVRQLLDKAASTSYPAEAEAFQAHAERLIARLALTDAELVQESDGRPGSVVVEVKHCVGRVRAVYTREHLIGLNRCVRAFGSCVPFFERFQACRWLTVVGVEDDCRRMVAVVESLQRQAQWAMQSWWRYGRGQVEDSASSWERLQARRAFLKSFYVGAAERIGQVVSAEAQTVAAGELVLRSKLSRAEQWVDDRYGPLVDSRLGHADGWSQAGYEAGQAATIGGESLPDSRLRGIA